MAEFKVWIIQWEKKQTYSCVHANDRANLSKGYSS